VVGADDAERRSLTGDGVTVALVDTGIADVADLRGRVVPIVDPLTGRSQPCQDLSGEDHCDDSYGHGTFLAGLIAGSGASSGGEHRGVAPGTRLVSVKVAGADGSADVSTVLGAIQWVVSYKDQYGIDVLNLSLGTNGTQSYQVDPFNYAVERAWHAGITVVVAAGNLGPDPGSVTKPADDPWVISIGAVDDRGTPGLGDDVVPRFSARGPARQGVAKPDAAAPGGHVVSLSAPGSTIDRTIASGDVDGYLRGSGTSMSAAITSGVVALVRQAQPGWGPDQVKAALVATARTAGSDDPDVVGAGVVDAAAAASWSGEQRANVGLDRSNGTGLLDVSRGSVRVEVADGLIPIVVQGQLTVQVLLWDPLGFVTGDWDRRTWLSTSWVTSGLLTTTWHGHNWHGDNWHGAAWYGDDVAVSYGRPGPGAAWYGAWD
jgi:serine protease AprX